MTTRTRSNAWRRQRDAWMVKSLFSAALVGSAERRIRPRRTGCASHDRDSPDPVRWFRCAEPPCVLRVVLAHQQPHQTFLARSEESRSDRAFRFAHRTVNESRRTPPSAETQLDTDDTSEHLRVVVGPVRHDVAERRTPRSMSRVRRFRYAEPAILCRLLTTCRRLAGVSTTTVMRCARSLIECFCSK